MSIKRLDNFGKINREKIAINKDGIKVKSANETMYFLFATEPLKLMLFLIEFLISIKITAKNIRSRIILDINNDWRLFSFNLIKLLSINVKNVIKAKESVNIKIIIINKFLFNKTNII